MRSIFPSAKGEAMTNGLPLVASLRLGNYMPEDNEMRLTCSEGSGNDAGYKMEDGDCIIT